MKPVKKIRADEIVPWDYIKFDGHHGLVSKVNNGMINVYVTVSGQVYPLSHDKMVDLMTKD